MVFRGDSSGVSTVGRMLPDPVVGPIVLHADTSETLRDQWTEAKVVRQKYMCNYTIYARLMHCFCNNETTRRYSFK